jgi:hypothetical protein
MRPPPLRIAAFSSVLAATAPAAAGTLSVGPGETYATPCAAIAAAQAGDTVEVAAGTYTDSCDIEVQGLTLVGVGGMPKIDLSGTNHPADYKGIYVVDADDVTIENMELTGANVDDCEGSNGAGLRVTGHNLLVHGCYIHDNQDGILAAPLVDGGTLTVEYTELSHNGLGDGCDTSGCTHNVYASSNGTITFDQVIFQYNWSHDLADDLPDKGHLLKSRARETDILYNRISGEDGHESYCVDLPNGGLGIVLGNVIQQGTMPDNDILLDYGEEGLSNPDTRLFVVANTFVNDFGKGTFINVAAGGTLVAHDNLFSGAGTLSSTGALSADNLDPANPMFVDAATYDYHLLAGSPAIGAGVDPGSVGTVSLTPVFEYVQPTSRVARDNGAKLDVGAFAFASAMGGGGAGSGGAGGQHPGAGGAAAAGTGAGGTEAGGGGAAGGGQPAAKGGCGCDVPGTPAGAPTALLLAAVAMCTRRRADARRRIR